MNSEQGSKQFEAYAPLPEELIAVVAMGLGMSVAPAHK
jgi:hypothetical protein